MVGKRDQHHRSENINITLEQLIPQNHLVRKVDQIMDFEFIYPLVEKLYCENNGRPSIDPVLLIKMALLQYLFGIPYNASSQMQKKSVACVGSDIVV